MGVASVYCTAICYFGDSEKLVVSGCQAGRVS